MGSEGKGKGAGLEAIAGICFVKIHKTIVMIHSMHTLENSLKSERQFDKTVRSFPEIRSRSWYKPFILAKG